MKAAVLLLAVALSGCSTLVRAPQQNSHVSEARLYNRGYEAGVQATLHNIRHDKRLRVSYYALAPCKTFRAWVPPTGDITPEVWWRAIQKERDLKKACAARHDALREQVKALLGVIRDYE